ncbi:MAG: TetR/AcrR family transcriptional regulator [Clostridia bacterium]|nr:TetR/AcrR family transcriptional regulator [Clostridia bacterium]
MDRRKSRTERAIKAAFSELICEKSYSEISIQDVIDRADVARATFYDHYKNKEEVLRSISAGIFAHVNAETLSAEKHHDFSHEKDFLHRIVHLLCHLYEDKGVISGILASESHDIFLDDLRRHLDMSFERGYCPPEGLNVPEEIVKNHAVTSLMELVLWWMKIDGCKTPPREMADYYFLLLGMGRAQ